MELCKITPFFIVLGDFMYYTKEDIPKGHEDEYICADVGNDGCGNIIYFYRKKEDGD